VISLETLKLNTVWSISAVWHDGDRRRKEL